jgi:hypothetical protein
MGKKYKIYMAKCQKDGTIKKGTLKDLEIDFRGLLYSKCEGLNLIGSAKNVYVETFADSEESKVHVPDVIYNTATTIKLTLYFVGENRYNVKSEFDDYIRNGYTQYWDDARCRWFQFYVKEDISIAEEKWYGSKPYLKCEYNLNNIHGKTTRYDNNPLI